MSKYNYRINYDNGSVTEILQCDKIDTSQIMLEKVYRLNLNVDNKTRTITINTSHIIYIDEWESEELQ